MLRASHALPGALAVVSLLGLGVPAASGAEATAAALPVAEITQRNAGAVVIIWVKVLDQRMSRYGSGFLVDPGGTIVTALHLIDRAERILIRIPDGKSFKHSTIRAYDLATDLAVLQIDGADLPVVEIGSTSGLKSGDSVLVISNPLALTRTVTEGVLGAWRDPPPLPAELSQEELEEERDFGARRHLRRLPATRILQISAPITHGSSGAPVFDRSGRVVGVALAGLSYGELDLNFAIPAERITPLLERDDGLTLTSLQQRTDLDRADLAEPHIQEARLRLELEQYEEAEREIDAALQLFPTSSEALLLESELLLRRGDQEAAELRLLQIARLEPESAEVWHRLGELYLQREHGQELAREALEKALGLDGSLASAWHGLGVIAVREGRYRSATELLERARELEPEGAETYVWLGEVHLRMGRGHDAEAAFSKAVRLAEDDPLAYHGLARAYAVTGQDGRARDHYRKFLELTEGVPKHEALRERTILYLQRYPDLAPLEYADLIGQRASSFVP